MTLLSTFIKVGGTAVILKDIADRIVNTRLTREQTLRRNRAGMLVLGVAIGSTIGAVAGVLFAPRPGSETRKDLCRSSGEAWGQVKERVAATSHRLADAVEERGSRVRTAAEKGVDAARASFNDSADEQKEASNG